MGVDSAAQPNTTARAKDRASPLTPGEVSRQPGVNNRAQVGASKALLEEMTYSKEWMEAFAAADAADAAAAAEAAVNAVEDPTDAWDARITQGVAHEAAGAESGSIEAAAIGSAVVATPRVRYEVHRGPRPGCSGWLWCRIVFTYGHDRTVSSLSFLST